jgi:nitrate reductase gamma subunit
MFAVLFYFAAGLFAVGLTYRIVTYARTPAPLKIPTTPAPRTRTGVVLLMAREVFFFESLFKASLWTWLFSALFHAGLALVLLRHVRYFIDPVWSWVIFIQPFGIYAGFMMVAGLMGLWGRRFFFDSVRYI